MIQNQYHVFYLVAQQFNEDDILFEMMPLNTHKKIAQEQLQHAQQIAARDLVRSLAYEIKNPLGGLRGAAQLLSHELQDQECKDYMKIIIEQADRLRNLVDRLLGPQQIPQKQKNNIHQAIELTYALLMLEKSDNITIEKDYDPSLPDLIHDSEQIEQVILNITRNALQALDGTPNGKIVIKTRTAFYVTMHGQCHRLSAHITIQDNGPGVPIHLQDTIFYPMVSGRENGSGLGLSIARTIIDKHNGKLEFSSWPGQTQFSIYLPIQ